MINLIQSVLQCLPGHPDSIAEFNFIAQELTQDPKAALQGETHVICWCVIFRCHETCATRVQLWSGFSARHEWPVALPAHPDFPADLTAEELTDGRRGLAREGQLMQA